MNHADESQFQSALANIRGRATALDVSEDWPAEDLADLAAAGAMRWAVPVEFGGEEVPPLELHLRYEALAAASLSTALVLTQRDSAVGFINGAEQWAMRPTFLRQLAANEFFATIGIAQLTTSRQGGAPALAAMRVNDGYRLNGYIPWSTGPAKSAFVVAGANLSDGGGQILFALPTDLAGIHIRPPMELVALRSSWTTAIDCRDVVLEAKYVLRDPAPNALAGRRKGLALSQVFLAMGLCRGGLDLIATHDSDRGRGAHARFNDQLQELRGRVLEQSQAGRETEAAAAGPSIRGACNELALRITHAAVALFKGTALMNDHPAQRLAREAMFLLVWSCPDPVIECTVQLLSGEII